MGLNVGRVLDNPPKEDVARLKKECQSLRKQMQDALAREDQILGGLVILAVTYGARNTEEFGRAGLDRVAAEKLALDRTVRDFPID